jgi:hypothetical protein
MNIDDLKNSIVDLYQNVKIRKQSDAKLIDKKFLEEEKSSLLSISPIVLINYIKIHLNLLIDIKVDEKIAKIKANPMDYISSYGSELPANDYEKLLRRYEGDIRNYIKYVNMLKIHIDELNEKQEILEKQIEQLQKEAFNFIPTTQSIEYKKKIEELTALIKTYEKHNLKIPLLEKKIKIQKIELDKLDSFYKKQIKSYTKKISEYEKGIYLNKNNSIMRQSKLFKSNFNTSIYHKKSKNKINSISPKRDISKKKEKKHNELNMQNQEKDNHMKKTKSINNIFFRLKNEDIKKKIEDKINNITTNTNNSITNNINGGNLLQGNIHEKSENTVYSPKFGDNKIIDSYYDSIETENLENNNKTINMAEVEKNFKKKINLKFNCNNSNKILFTNRDKDKDKGDNKKNIKRIQARSNSKKIIKRLNTNKSTIKIPKKIPDHINTSKYICTKEKNIPKISRYNSLRQVNNGKNKSIHHLKKNNEQFNKTFSKIPIINNTNVSNGPYSKNSNNNINQSQRNIVKNLILNKINNTIIVNGRTPIPIQRTQSKTQSFIK